MTVVGISMIEIKDMKINLSIICTYSGGYVQEENLRKTGGEKDRRLMLK